MKKFLPVALLVGLLVVFRIVSAQWSGAMPGFEPLTAVFFCAAAFLGGRWLWVPLVAWLVSYPLTNLQLGYGWDWQILVALAGFAVAAWVGFGMRRQRNPALLLGGAAGAAVLFFLITGFGSWLLLPDYPKTPEGLFQALWMGAPHHALPSWAFLRGGMTASLLFTGLFLLGQRQLQTEPRGELAPARVRQ